MCLPDLARSPSLVPLVIHLSPSFQAYVCDTWSNSVLQANCLCLVPPVHPPLLAAAPRKLGFSLENKQLQVVLFLLFFLNYISLVRLLQLSQFFPLCPSPPSTPSGNPHTAVHVHGSRVYAVWLLPSPSFIQCPLPSNSCQYVPCFHSSLSILLVSLFCPLDSTYKWDLTVSEYQQPCSLCHSLST